MDVIEAIFLVEGLCLVGFEWVRFPIFFCLYVVGFILVFFFYLYVFVECLV